MSPSPTLPYGLLILREREVVHASPLAAALCGSTPSDLAVMDLEGLLGFFSYVDARRIERLVRWVEKGELADPQVGMLLQSKDGRQVSIDLLISAASYQGQPAVQMVWVDNSPKRQLEQQLSQNIWRLQAMHDIDQAMLSLQDEVATAQVALRHISYLADDYYASTVFVVEASSLAVGSNQVADRKLAADSKLAAGNKLTAELLAFDRDSPELEGQVTSFPLDELAFEVEALKAGLPLVFQDLDELDELSLVQVRLRAVGVRACVSAPICWDEALHGMLNIYSRLAGDFPAERVQVAVEIASLLAVAIRQSHMKKAERERREEAEAMRDVMASLAGTGDLNQSLQSVLVNLHNVIAYDHASLYLVDENERFVVTQDLVSQQKDSGRAFHEHNPLLDQMRERRQPLIIDDIQGDERFADWLEVETLRGWLGAPLIAGEEMVGFISLGSLQPGSFTRADAERLRFFAEQIAHVLERAWQNELDQRRKEEMEVLSSVTLALGKAESSEDTLQAVLMEIAHFVGAQSGVFLFPDRLETKLVVKASLDEAVLGMSFPSRWDPLWGVYVRGETSILELQESLLESAELNEPDRAVLNEEHRRIFKGAQAAILAPVKVSGSTFGVLGFGFEDRLKVNEDSLRLSDAVAEIAAASLRRAVVLETLEKQVDVRTQHLSTLYDINAVASEALELPVVLEQVLRLTLESLSAASMGYQSGVLPATAPANGQADGSTTTAGQMGLIHFYSEKEGVFNLAVQHGLPEGAAADFQTLWGESGFWGRLAASSNPVVIQSTASEPNLPPEFTALRRATGELRDQLQAFIGAPIRAKGKVLGLLSLFDRSILDYTIEDITLFMTIADQIGGLVERARLMKQAEIAAVVQERQRLARELHDSVTQLLYSQMLFAGAGLKVLSQGDQEAAEQHLERINGAALQALKEMRLLVYQLRPSDYLEEGLEGALRRRLDSVEKRTGINARLVVDGDLSLDESVEMALYRIAEEALNNTLKHAQASSVTITLCALESSVRLEIVDDGLGFDVTDSAGRSQREAGMGLGNMRERAQALGGTCEIESRPGKGTRVRVELEVQG